MRHRPAPSAEQTASSCWRASARTTNRLATLVQAISITMPIVAITTQSTVWMLPTTASFSGCNAGVMLRNAAQPSKPGTTTALYVGLSGPDARSHASAARALGFDPKAQVQDPLTSTQLGHG